MNLRTRTRALLLGVFVLAAAPVQGWYGKGHRRATRLAVTSLENSLPAFFVRDVSTTVHCSIDPDLFKSRATPQLRDREYPEHYFDVELLGGAKSPDTRYAFLDLCSKKGIRPSKAGALLYAVAEGTQRLTIVFAEHRKWPNNRDCSDETGIF